MVIIVIRIITCERAGNAGVEADDGIANTQQVSFIHKNSDDELAHIYTLMMNLHFATPRSGSSSGTAR
jgi:hypothetical protein